MTNADRDPELTPAMKTSVEKLDTAATQLIDSYGHSSEVLTPGEDNPNAREIEFHKEAVIAAGFDDFTTVRAYDSPPYGEVESSAGIHKVWFSIMHDDGELVRDRYVRLRHLPDGSIDPKARDEVYPSGLTDDDWDAIAATKPEPTQDQKIAFMEAYIAEGRHEIFSQAECDKLIKLVEEERKLRQT